MKNTPLISFEFFPPKTPQGKDQLSTTALTLANCDPDFFSVTFGAGGSTREGTVNTVKFLKSKTKMNVAPHLSCIASSRAEVMRMLEYYKLLGITRLVALRGDLPSGIGQAGELKYASDLVALIRENTGDHFHIEVAAYPEIHPQARSVKDDILNLKRKYEAGADSAITQYFFNPDAYFYYQEECTAQKIELPIIPGIMPITQYTKLSRFSEICGAEIPRWICKRLESFGDDLTSIKNFGLEVVATLCETLIDGGAPGLHFYTLNQATATIEILKSVFGDYFLAQEKRVV